MSHNQSVSLEPINADNWRECADLAPQFLVDDLARSIAYYRKLGFEFGEPWGGFYAIGRLDGLELHLKEAPKKRSRAKASQG